MSREELFQFFSSSIIIEFWKPDFGSLALLKTASNLYLMTQEKYVLNLPKFLPALSQEKDRETRFKLL